MNLKTNATVARQMFMSQQNIMTHHDMSHTCHMRHICMPGNQIIKNNFAHVTICQMQLFNPIQSKWVVAIQIVSV